MSPAMTGALIGFVIGFMGFVSLRIVANRIETKSVTPEPKKTAAVIRIVALADWLLFTVLGFFLGPIMFTTQS
ncbi:MAG: hypothetical protein AAF346_18605 [Pseudomonadota bacterium]